uniref:Uncharacterized protein n=1 Tax=Moniliophthora roreri TaxID=221103 RepID=A0A0W0FND2_MONRR
MSNDKALFHLTISLMPSHLWLVLITTLLKPTTTPLATASSSHAPSPPTVLCAATAPPAGPNHLLAAATITSEVCEGSLRFEDPTAGPNDATGVPNVNAPNMHLLPPFTLLNRLALDNTFSNPFHSADSPSIILDHAIDIVLHDPMGHWSSCELCAEFPAIANDLAQCQNF